MQLFLTMVRFCRAPHLEEEKKLQHETHWKMKLDINHTHTHTDTHCFLLLSCNGVIMCSSQITCKSPSWNTHIITLHLQLFKSMLRVFLRALTLPVAWWNGSVEPRPSVMWSLWDCLGAEGEQGCRFRLHPLTCHRPLIWVQIHLRMRKQKQSCSFHRLSFSTLLVLIVYAPKHSHTHYMGAAHSHNSCRLWI